MHVELVSVVYALINLKKKRFHGIEILIVFRNWTSLVILIHFQIRLLIILKDKMDLSQISRRRMLMWRKLRNFELLRNFEIRRNYILSTDLTQFGTSFPLFWRNRTKKDPSGPGVTKAKDSIMCHRSVVSLVIIDSLIWRQKRGTVLVFKWPTNCCSTSGSPPSVPRKTPWGNIQRRRSMCHAVWHWVENVAISSGKYTVK